MKVALLQMKLVYILARQTKKDTMPIASLMDLPALQQVVGSTTQNRTITKPAAREHLQHARSGRENSHEISHESNEQTC